MNELVIELIISPLLLEPFVARLRPRVADDPHLLLHLRHRPIDPTRNVASCWQARCPMNYSFGNHPRHPLPPDTIFEWLVKANIDRLAEGSTSAWDVLHLYSQLLNSCDYRSHHVATVAVKDEEGNDVIRCVGDVWF